MKFRWAAHSHAARRMFRVSLLLLLTGQAVALTACGRGAPATPDTRGSVVVRAELRSWKVAGRARHLYLQVDAPPPYDELDGRVEFTSLALRRGYALDSDSSGQPRVGRMTIGEPLAPALGGDPGDRLEAVYTLTLEQAECVTRDRVFSAPYVLLGTNSNAGLRRTMESCGLGIPARVLQGGGMLGEFPGIETDPGEELPGAEWASFGLAASAAGQNR